MSSKSEKNVSKAVSVNLYSDAINGLLEAAEAVVLEASAIDKAEAHELASICAAEIEAAIEAEEKAKAEAEENGKASILNALKAKASAIFGKASATASSSIVERLMTEASGKETRRDTTLAQVLLEVAQGKYIGKADIAGLTLEVSARRGREYKQAAMRRALQCIEQRQGLKISLPDNGKPTFKAM